MKKFVYLAITEIATASRVQITVFLEGTTKMDANHKPVENHVNHSDDNDLMKKQEKPRFESESYIENINNGTGSGGCPFFHQKVNVQPQVSYELNTGTSVNIEPISYCEYLHLDKVLGAQFPMSKKYASMVHDEHLFIIIHQGEFASEKTSYPFQVLKSVFP